MFSAILVPLDRSELAECVLPHAVAAAKAFGAHITLLHVLAPVRIGRVVRPLDWQFEHIEAEQYLETTAARLRLALPDAPLEVHTMLVEGAPADTIVGILGTLSRPLVVLSTHGQSGLTDWIISSVTQKIAARAPASLLIVRAHLGPDVDRPMAHYARVLVPLDGSQRAECVAPVAAQLALWHAADILLIHVVSRPEMPRRMPLSREEAALLDAIMERNRREGEQYVDDMRARIAGDARTQVMVGHHVATALQEAVVRESADIVVVSAHGYSGTSDRPVGSVARSLLEHCAAHVLIVQDSRINAPVTAASREDHVPRAFGTVSGVESQAG